MIFIVFLVIGLGSLVAAAILRNKVAVIASVIFFLSAVLIPTSMYLGNMGALADLEAFYNASSTNFEIARSDTASFLSEDKIMANTALIPITGSIEKMGLGQSVAQRVAEYRDTVNLYNSSFNRYQAYSRSILVGFVYPEVPKEMRLLIINPVQNSNPNNYQGNTNPQPQTQPVYGPNLNETQKRALEDLIKQGQNILGK